MRLIVKKIDYRCLIIDIISSIVLEILNLILLIIHNYSSIINNFFRLITLCSMLTYRLLLSSFPIGNERMSNHDGILHFFLLFSSISNDSWWYSLFIRACCTAGTFFFSLFIYTFYVERKRARGRSPYKYLR